MEKNIDIIIPIYNAYDDLQKCLESIIKWTDLKQNRLILVNDCSPDKNILPLIEKYKKTYQEKEIHIINSLVNEGFSASVNKGIEFSENNDVLLLNSDTIVTKNWINKISACAYSDSGIATVTPLSNSATLCSVPIFCQDNPIPEGINIDEMGEIVERCSLRQYPRITVAVGFCMFIKRSIIKKVGLFDAETFQKGYGEENDFCYRAEELGYYHVMCDDTFIYHKGTVSFMTDEKLKLIQEHEKILKQRYEKLVLKNAQYCENNPEQYIRDNLNIYLNLKNKKKNILYLIHSDFREDAHDHVGGTQFHVKDLTLNLKKNYNIFVMARDKNYLRLTIYRENGEDSFKFYIGEKNEYPELFNIKHRKIYQEILNAFQINLIHVHHIFGLTFDLYYVAQEYNIPVITTIHDYYYICPTIKLVNNNKVFCMDKVNEEECKLCLESKCYIYKNINFIQNWREEVGKILCLNDKIIFPSQSSKDIFTRYYPDILQKSMVIKHGYDIEASKELEIPKNIIISSNIRRYTEHILEENNNLISGWMYLENVDSKKVKIIISISDGNIEKYYETNKIERSDVANGNELYLFSGFSCHINDLNLFNNQIKIKYILKYEEQYYVDQNDQSINIQKKEKNKLHVGFIGGLSYEKGCDKAYELISHSNLDINWYIFGHIEDIRLRILKRKNLFKVGQYKREDISLLLREYQIDILCILPIWPETFCYTLTESIKNNIPVIATDIGAVGERMKENQCGWLVSVENTFIETTNILEKILNNRNILEEVKEHIKEIYLENLTDMCSDYINLYDELVLSKEQCFEIYNATFIFNNHILSHNAMDNIDLKKQLVELEGKLNSIETSLGYKLLKKMYNKMNRSFMRRIYNYVERRRKIGK